MNKCFITKLQGVVDNTSLLKLGELRIGFSNNGNPRNIQSIGIGVTNPISLEILGDGYFTSSNGNENFGKTMNFNNSASVVNIIGTNTLSIIKKYNLTAFSVSSKQTNIAYFCIDDLKASKELGRINLESKNVTGDIASLVNLTKLNSLSLKESKVVGDIASLENLKELTTLNLTSTFVSGNLNILSKLPKLQILYISNTNIIGNINDLYSNSKLTEILATNTDISGDLAKLPESCIFISINNKNDTSFTWSTRSTSSKIIAINGKPKITNIDKMLQDQAQCESAITSSTDIDKKYITATGTRTSASDAAVQTLQSKGYTVSITPA